MQAKQRQHSLESPYSIQRIENPSGWQFIDFAELWRYRDLFLFMVWRDIRGRYAQSILGIGWAVIQPLVSMIVFTIIFGNFVEVASYGVPYAIFNYTAVVPWVFFRMPSVSQLAA
jgi:lipopolysaccharide transport system permease protein